MAVRLYGHSFMAWSSDVLSVVKFRLVLNVIDRGRIQRYHRIEKRYLFERPMPGENMID